MCGNYCTHITEGAWSQLMAETEMTGEDIAGNYRLPKNVFFNTEGIKTLGL